MAAYRGIGDLIASFSPTSDLFAIASADGRIKVWDVVKGQLQAEFADIEARPDDLFSHPEERRGHLAVDYKCMEWVNIEGKKIKKKQKPGSLLLVLGTGNGDIMAINVATGDLTWKVLDCHPGGANAVKYLHHHLCVYTAGVDGMVCRIDAKMGSMLGKFKASTKPISSMSISVDGTTLATAAGQLKLINCSDNKKIKKLSGHSLAVRCIIFSEGGDYILSSGVGERYVAIWKIDEGKRQHASCVLSMEHPPVFLDCKGTDTSGSGLYVLAISEMGVCYFWYGSSLVQLQISKPTKISLSIDSSLLKDKNSFAIFAAKFQEPSNAASAQVLFAYSSLIKPSFEKLLVNYGIDVSLNVYRDGVLLPKGHPFLSQPAQSIKREVTALDRANAEDAVNPVPKLYLHERKRKHGLERMVTDNENSMLSLVEDKNLNSSLDENDYMQKMVENNVSLEDRLREVGVLGEKLGNNNEFNDIVFSANAKTFMLNGINLLADSYTPANKARADIQSMLPINAYKLLETLIYAWRTRPSCSKNVLLWIKLILVYHKNFIGSQSSSRPLLDELLKMSTAKATAVQPLLKLSGSLDLVNVQISKSGLEVSSEVESQELDDSDEEEEDVEDLVYGDDDDDNGAEGGSDDDAR